MAPSSVPHLGVGAGKQGYVYLLDRDDLTLQAGVAAIDQATGVGQVEGEAWELVLLQLQEPAPPT